MRFHLSGFIILSKPIGPENVSKLSQLIEEANTRLLVKGAPKGKESEGAQIISWRVEENRLFLEIISGRYVRAHDALFRLKNSLASSLGKEFKIGVRGLGIKFYEIKVPGFKGNVEEIKKLISDLGTIEVVDENLIIKLKELSEDDLQERLVDRLIKKVLEGFTEVVEETKLVPFGYVIEQAKPKPIKVNVEVATEAEKLGWIKRFPSKGQWIFAAPMVGLLKVMRDLIVNHVCRPLGFEEWMFPRLIPMLVLAKLSSYVEHLPEGMFYVCAPPRDPSAFDEYKREYTLKRIIRKDLLKRILDEPEYVLDAVQCPPFYQFFSEETVRLEDLPIKVYECMGGWTWRNEAGGVEGVARTNEFWRMEMVYLGSPRDVVKIRDDVVSKTVELIDKVLDLEWRTVVGAPFYLSSEEASKKRIDISSRDKIPTIDIECYLPYRGERGKAEWLEITAASVHYTHYVSAFKIKEVKGRDIWTGCVGHGLTRWATAFLAQHGFDPVNWPSEVRRLYEQYGPYRIIRTLEWPPK
ncbi:MAG: serine--tRNA ligase [Candidatus Nezhaarchaeota archaeon]|nr:serine--tRNA ligase [Candidatus Nezhaarchaeota archaeon]MCX8141966.1 serine--tRNA ligase [Candidatus Nezhaarchaeota archaeon]MDW8050253.1 aminoacyl--tRNA ligase-related protein [Nitrososphaerota archaeon]